MSGKNASPKNRNQVERIRENAQAAQLIGRLRSNAMGDFHCVRTVFKKLCDDIEALLGVSLEGHREDLKAILKENYMRMKMDMAQVKSAEIVLKKVVPDLAQHEYKGRIDVNNVVQVTQKANSTEAWAQNAIPHAPQKALNGK